MQSEAIGSRAGEAGAALRDTRRLERWTPVVAAVLCLLVLGVYLSTVGLTAPFWDAGEFIPSAYVLGIPHPPGTPLYVLLGRIACLVPVSTIAARVNALSAIAATLAVLFTFLATVRLVRPMWGSEKVPWFLPLLAGVVAALAIAFSDTFWVNAVEAEVYALSSMVMAICLWAVLKWRELPHREQRIGWLLVVFYLLSLSIGVHLGTYLVLPGLALLVALEWIQSRTLKMAVVALVLVLPPVGAALVALLLVFSRPRMAAALGILFVVGVSVHLYLLIRAGVEPPPAINEGGASSWSALWDVLTRKQYPPSNLFERRGPLWFQFDRLYLHYLRDQFSVLQSSLGRAVPLALGILGAAIHTLRRRRDGAMMLTHFFFMCVLLVIYLNLSGQIDEETGRWVIGEVRERDYFFAPSFQVFAMWIGMGVAALALEVWRLGHRPRWRLGLIASAAAVVLMVGRPVATGFASRYAAHDRTHNYIARDYGYNILNFVEKDAILFTNGDNDTFPLWYLQEVEGVRRDVRVVCLSLLETAWYIRQCRDIEPRVRMSIPDDQLDSLTVAQDARSGQVYVLDARGRVLGPGAVKHVAARDIVASNPERPIYFAITVPAPRAGFDERLSLEGMTLRVMPEPPDVLIDFDRCYENVFRNYEFRGLLNDDLTPNRTVVVDDTGEYLIQNYVTMFLQLAYELNRRERHDEALRLLQASRGINPDLIQVDLIEGMMLDASGRPEAAAAIFERLVAEGRGVVDASYRLSLTRYRMGDIEAAMSAMRTVLEMAGDSFFEPVLWMARFHWLRGNQEAARGVVEGWVRAHPDDAEARAALEALARGDDGPLPR